MPRPAPVRNAGSMVPLIIILVVLVAAAGIAVAYYMIA
jgi:hypothetical protein